MRRVLVAVFDQQADAQQALDALLDRGFSRDNARLTSLESIGMASSTGQGADRKESFGEKVSELFGFDNDKTYSEAAQRGHCVLTVDVDDDEAKYAEEIMERYNPVDINERAAQWREGDRQAHEVDTHTATGTIGHTTSQAPLRSVGQASEQASAQTIGHTMEQTTGQAASHAMEQTAGEATGEEIVIPIIEERIQIGKREVRHGHTRIRTHTYTIPVEENIRLHEQHTDIRRRPANRLVTEEDRALGEAEFDTYDIVEEPIIGKEARVVEEVVISKKSSDQTRTVKENVRRTDVDVERVDDDGRTTSARERA
ncbi:MAG TPA: YsnF/AvaK domain-containing protein [Nitrococcus sp.]|nr:YsnF/AvaK domain-containing protein [Nitrococcus sp.]